jgi:hypothetical protein
MLGLMLVIVGRFGAVVVNVIAFEVPTPGLATVTLAVPWLAIWVAGTEAVNCAPFR